VNVFQFQASGYCGGFFNLMLDTEQELQRAAVTALGDAGFRVSTVTVEADEWDVTTRIFSNQFHYRLTATLESNAGAAAALQSFQSTVQKLTGLPVTVSDVSSGGKGQPLPNSNPFPSLPAINWTIGLVAALGVVVLVLIAEAK